MRRARSARNKSQKAEGNDEVQNTNTVWQWMGDEGQWESYPAADCVSLNSAVSDGEQTASLTLSSGHIYTFDLKKMLQINPNTKYKRKIRTQAVKQEGVDERGDSLAVNGAPSATVKKEEEEEEETVKKEEEEEETTEQPAAKRKRGQSGKKTKTKTEDVKTEVTEVVRTVVMKGKAPVDLECKAKLGKAHVYNEGNEVFDVMLNQTNLQFNNNKYYLIQLLQDEGSKSYSVWMRWGRVGKVGQSSLTACGGDLLKAKDLFKKKFLDKTKNDWEHRASFEKVPGKYDMVFMDYSTNDKPEEPQGPVVDSVPQKKLSRLGTQLQSLLELITDLKAMEECVLEMKFDTRKAPLGKLTPEQIRAGYSALKKIEECLKKKNGSRELLEACNQFYTRIPHDFGLKTPPLIRSEEELKEKIALLEALSDIQIAVKMVQSSENSDEHPLDRQYRALQCHMLPLEAASNEFKTIERYLQSTHASTHSDYCMTIVDMFCVNTIERYLQSTHASTHSDYSMTVVDMFSVDRQAERDSFLSHIHNKTLLWHGSRLSNWMGILSQGLRVAPPEAPVTGYMFGKGIYFADMSSKSANYCFANQNNQVGLLLLCEVALGDSNELLGADYEANKLPAGKHSVKGLGRTAPEPKNSVDLDGVSVPMGPCVNTGVGKSSAYSLLYNEFIVYNPAQTRMRYLLRVKFNYSSLW